jgi:hypothetical protein
MAKLPIAVAAHGCACLIACGLACSGLLGIHEPRDPDSAAPLSMDGAVADGDNVVPEGSAIGDAAQDVLGTDRTGESGTSVQPGNDGAANDADASRQDAVCPTTPPFLCADANAPDGLTFFTDFDQNCLAIPVIQENQPALYELNCNKFVSPPASLHLQAPSLGNFVGYLNLEKSLRTFPKHAHVEFDLLVASYAPNTATNAFALGADKVGAMGSGFVLFLQPDATQPSVVDCFVQDYQPDGTPDQAQNCTGGIPMQTWLHLVFDMQRSDAGLPLHLSIAVRGSGLLFDRNLRSFIDGPNFHLDFRNGTYEDGGGQWDLYFDNVSVLDQ